MKMFGKIKKVLVSLALAASLALAPMNVSAKEGSEKNASGNLCASKSELAAIETPINVTIADSYSWTVIVPDSFSLTSENSYRDSGSIALDLSSVLGSKTLTVTSNLNRESTYSNTIDYPIGIEGGVVSFTATSIGPAPLEVSITESAWKTSCPDGLDDVKVAGITYAIIFS